MNNYNGGPAFPVGEVTNANGETVQYPSEGMSLRDYFAAHAPNEPDDWIETLAARATYVEEQTSIALWRFEYADAMLKARGEPH